MNELNTGEVLSLLHYLPMSFVKKEDLNERSFINNISMKFTHFNFYFNRPFY